MRVSNLRVLSNAKRAYQQNAYLKIFTLPSSGATIYDAKKIRRSMNFATSDSMIHSTKTLNLRTRSRIFN